ncbi:MAG: AAA family ATPase [Caulobacteraceae bacterium]|nr:AAA family ATPase [Caulobacteraceae bacterium]
MSARFVVLSGCSSGGKSTLLAELQRRGYACVEEPGRRIVREEQLRGGTALPWVEMQAFARRAIEVALADRYAALNLSGWVFFDRGLVDAACALQEAASDPALERLGWVHRYHQTVFLAPPWPEIYAADPERRHGFEAAQSEYRRLEQAYPALGYRIVTLPKVPVAARADFLLAELEAGLG